MEADYFGMLLSASAGYDPREAPESLIDFEILGIARRICTMEASTWNPKLFISGDLNGLGISRYVFDSVHRGFSFGERNEPGNSILDYALSYDLILANTWFRERESHLITFRSGSSASQIDFFLTRKVDRCCCMDCKVVPGESVVTQHRLLVLNIWIRRKFRKNKCKLDPNIKWWRLKEGNNWVFVDRVIHEANWEVQDDLNTTWKKIASCIKRVAKDILGELWGGAPSCKDTLW